MQKRLIYDQKLLDVTISRLCHQLIENHGVFEDTVILGLQPRGVFLAERIKKELERLLSREITIGYLDSTFFRDDFRRREAPLKANATKVPFIIEDKKVILIDDVLFTGRTVRSAMDAMISLGRPLKVELLVLINRLYSRDLPIEPNYVGKKVNTTHTQKVVVEWLEGEEGSTVWIMN